MSLNKLLLPRNVKKDKFIAKIDGLLSFEISSNLNFISKSPVQNSLDH